MLESPYVDPVVAEIHAIRAEMLAAAGGDVREMMQQVARRQASSTHPVITDPFRKQSTRDSAAK